MGQNVYLERTSRPLRRPDWEGVTSKWFDEVAKHSGRQTLNPYRCVSVSSTPAFRFLQIGAPYCVYSTLGPCPPFCRFSAVTGHFTQVAWADSFLMGCGLSEYRETYGGRPWYTRLYVCNYGPAGNIIGDWMYRAGEACTSCGAESYCYYGLCV